MSESVERAFDALVAAVNQKSHELARQIAQAAAKEEFEKVTALSRKWKLVEDFKPKISRLAAEWRDLVVQASPGRDETESRAMWSPLTPRDAYVVPILEAVSERGVAPVAHVLDLVYKKMAGVLHPGDLEPIPSNPRMPRWRKYAQRCRLELVHRGLIRADSPKGLWEITDEGRAFLRTSKEGVEPLRPET
ncbi:hypothetical protein HPY42_02630 [Coprothermobacteraceae bacterium]|nr:hypothetical protein [Coprothermobacteraceae bacterium]